MKPPRVHFVAQLAANRAAARHYGRDVFADAEGRDGDGCELEPGIGVKKKSRNRTQSELG